MDKPYHCSSSPCVYIYIYDAKIGLLLLKPRICMFAALFHWQHILRVEALFRLIAGTGLVLDSYISPKKLDNTILRAHDYGNRFLLEHLHCHCRIMFFFFPCFKEFLNIKHIKNTLLSPPVGLY